MRRKLNSKARALITLRVQALKEEVMANWIQNVKTSSVSEGPPGTLGADKTPDEMARVLLAHNRSKTKGSIIRYMQFVINRSGHQMKEAHRDKIKRAMEIVRLTTHR